MGARRARQGRHKEVGVYLRRMRNGVRSAPREDRHRRPAFDSTLEVSTSARSDASDTQGICSRKTDQPCEPQSASLCRHHILVVLSRILQPGSGTMARPVSAPGTQPGVATAVDPGHADGPACPRPQPPARRGPLTRRGETTSTKSNATSGMRPAVRDDGARVIEKRSRTRSTATGGCGCH